jgi:hypothetical protein
VGVPVQVGQGEQVDVTQAGLGESRHQEFRALSRRQRVLCLVSVLAASDGDEDIVVAPGGVADGVKVAAVGGLETADEEGAHRSHR